MAEEKIEIACARATAATESGGFLTIFSFTSCISRLIFGEQRRPPRGPRLEFARPEPSRRRGGAQQDKK